MTTTREKNTATEGETPVSILYVAVADTDDALEEGLNQLGSVTRAERLKETSDEFQKRPPGLLVVNLDGDGWKFVPLINLARLHNVPVLAVATDQEAVRSVRPVKWSIDGGRTDAVVSAAEKLLDDPLFVPTDPKRYPPPPSSFIEDEHGTEAIASEEEKSSIDPSSVVPRSRSSRPSSPPWSAVPPPQASLARTSSIPDSNMFAIDTLKKKWEVSAGQLREQARALAKLQRQLDEVAGRRESVTPVLSEMVATLTSDQVARIEQLTEMVYAVSSDSEERSTDLTAAVEDQRIALSARIDALAGDIESMNKVFSEIVGTVTAESAALKTDVKRMLDVVTTESELMNVELGEQVDVLSAKLKRLDDTRDYLKGIVDEERRQRSIGFKSNAEHIRTLEEKLLDFLSRHAAGRKDQETRESALSDRVAALEQRIDELTSEAATLRRSNRENERIAQELITTLEERIDKLEIRQNTVVSSASVPRGATGENEMSSRFTTIERRFDAFESALHQLESAENNNPLLEKLEKTAALQQILLDRLDDFDKGVGAYKENRSRLGDLTAGFEVLLARIAELEGDHRPTQPMRFSDFPANAALAETSKSTLSQTSAREGQDREHTETLTRVRASLAKVQKDLEDQSK